MSLVLAITIDGKGNGSVGMGLKPSTNDKRRDCSASAGATKKAPSTRLDEYFLAHHATVIQHRLCAIKMIGACPPARYCCNCPVHSSRTGQYQFFCSTLSKRWGYCFSQIVCQCPPSEPAKPGTVQ